MADFLIRSDPDPKRREAHDADAASYFDGLPHSVRREWTIGSLRFVLSCNRETPTFTHREGNELTVATGTGSQSVLSSGGRRKANRTRRDGRAKNMYDCWSADVPFGFMAHLQGEQRAFVAADRLGLYPVYYFRSSDVRVIASTPSLIMCHPKIQGSVDRVALAGILLFSFPSGGRTLWKQVKRVPPGHAVECFPDSSPREREIWTPSDDIVPGTSDDFASRFDTKLEAWRSSIGEAPNFQLSGGLDSRVVAGYLADGPACIREAWTYGQPRDLEAQAAQKVAETCRFDHQVVPVDTGRYLDWAYAEIESNHLASAPSDFALWALGEHAANDDRRVVSGHLGDIIMGGNHIGRALGTDVSTEEAFATICARLNEGYGLAEDTLRRVLRGGDTEELIQQCRAELYSSYTKYGTNPFKRRWYFDLFHRDRLVIGRLILQIARFSWPELPYCTPGMVRVASTIPGAALKSRRVQKRVLKTRFPRLARVPLTRGEFDTWPLAYDSHLSRWGWRIRQGVSWRWRKGLQSALGIERRVNHRLWNINRNPGWRAIRQEARSHVSAAGSLLDEEVLQNLLPPPEDPIEVSDALSGTGRKTLMGLVLWARKFL